MCIDCNEVGFLKKNVKAICSIGQSAKKAADRTKGYIGEKGIGFKSVFKVADIVYISSGTFQFKLDRQKTLGMIAPILEAFPQEQRRQDETQILLKLKGEAELNNINKELDDVQPQLLIFLRKLTKLRIYTPSRRVQFTTERIASNPGFAGGETITTRMRGKINGKYELEYITDILSYAIRYKISQRMNTDLE